MRLGRFDDEMLNGEVDRRGVKSSIYGGGRRGLRFRFGFGF